MTAKCYPSAHRQSTNCCHFIQPFSQIQAFHCRQQNRPTMLLLLPGLHYQHCCCNCFSIFCFLKANHSGITCDILYAKYGLCKAGCVATRWYVMSLLLWLCLTYFLPTHKRRRKLKKDRGTHPFVRFACRLACLLLCELTLRVLCCW